jgi:hypothetical protein
LGPNNWERTDKRDKQLHILWSDGSKWKSEFIKTVKYGDSFLIDTDSISKNKVNSGLAVLYAADDYLAGELDFLPKEKTWSTEIPNWRVSTGFKRGDTQVSYQGEIDPPLPDRASLITFHPFIQFRNVENFLLVLNLRDNPIIETAEIEIYESYSRRFVGTSQISTNSVSMIPLDEFNFKPTDLPVFICRSIAGVPFGFGVGKDGNMLSLEHTLPPGSFSLFGDRRKVQSELKTNWFQTLRKE